MFHLKRKLHTTLMVAIILVQGILFPLSPLTVLAEEVQQPESTQTTTQQTTEEAGASSESTTTSTQKEAATSSAEDTSIQTNTTNTEQKLTDSKTDTTSTSTKSTSTDTQRGPTEPTGEEKSTYTYNEETGLWENDHYTWNPETKQTKPKSEPTYSYNPETGRWDTTEWVYSPEQDKYIKNQTSVASPPANPSLQQSNSTATGSPSGTQQSLQASPLNNAASGFTLSATGPNSNNTGNNSLNYSGVYDLFYNATISNNIDSTARSGDATVAQNTTGGNAQSGDATGRVDIINLLQSSWGLSEQDLTTFTSNILGDVYGDLLVNTGPLSNNSISNKKNIDLQVNAVENANINNNVDVEAVSGNATVESNTTGGDATSGTARAMVNTLNLINSMINSGRSFIGTVNIEGSLEGDILLPDGVLDQLLASNTGPNSNNKIENNRNVDIDADIESNQTINNNVNAQAESGNATVSNNTTAGNATSGDASTDVTILNFAGRNVSASNALLVFVNVFGKWVGVIMDAPAGANAAILGSGVNSDNQIANNSTLNADINAEMNATINNNINARAASGNAVVTNNTTGGDATSGDAHTSVNILNMTNSQFALSDWFGVLFINIFGDWRGSFGEDTAFGNPRTPHSNQEKASSASTNSSSSSSSGPQANGGVLQFRPASPAGAEEDSGSLSAVSSIPGSFASLVRPTNNSNRHVVTSDEDSQEEVQASEQTAGEPQVLASSESNSSNIPLYALMFSLALIGGERALTKLEKQKSKSK